MLFDLNWAKLTGRNVNIRYRLLSNQLYNRPENDAVALKAIQIQNPLEINTYYAAYLDSRRICSPVILVFVLFEPGLKKHFQTTVEV